MKLLKKLFLPVAILLTTVLNGQQTLGLNAQRTYDITPADYGLIFDTIRIPTDDGASLYAWHLYPGEKMINPLKKRLSSVTMEIRTWQMVSNRPVNFSD